MNSHGPYFYKNPYARMSKLLESLNHGIRIGFVLIKFHLLRVK